MVISDKKPIQEILGFLEGSEKVVLVGCNPVSYTHLDVYKRQK